MFVLVWGFLCFKVGVWGSVEAGESSVWDYPQVVGLCYAVGGVFVSLLGRFGFGR